MKKNKRHKQRSKREFNSEEFIKCPLCDFPIKHKIIGDCTHIWSCPECPFIGIEYYEEKNLIYLNKYLNGNIKECVSITINV